jgi:hypothetical protein
MNTLIQVLAITSFVVALLPMLAATINILDAILNNKRCIIRLKFLIFLGLFVWPIAYWFIS